MRNLGETVSALLLIYQSVSAILARNRNHRRHSTETSETMSNTHGFTVSGRPRERLAQRRKTMAKNTNPMADEYKVGTHGRLIYLHFGQETEEEEAERQALMLRVADSLGVAVLPPTQRKGPA
jgi:hypothetical protein